MNIEFKWEAHPFTGLQMNCTDVVGYLERQHSDGWEIICMPQFGKWLFKKVKS